MREREREVIGRETETCRGGGLVVSVLTVISDDRSSSLAQFSSLSVKFVC